MVIASCALWIWEGNKRTAKVGANDRLGGEHPNSSRSGTAATATAPSVAATTTDPAATPAVGGEKSGEKSDTGAMFSVPWSAKPLSVRLWIASTYALLMTIAFTAINHDVQSHKSGTGIVTTPRLREVLGFGLVIGGLMIRWSAQHTLGSLFTYDLAIRPHHKLVTTGVYSWFRVRHPGYFGSVMALFGLAFFIPSSILFVGVAGTIAATAVGLLWIAGTLVPLMRIRIPSEEKMLGREFGPEWVVWSKRNRWRLVPGVW